MAAARCTPSRPFYIGRKKMERNQSGRRWQSRQSRLRPYGHNGNLLRWKTEFYSASGVRSRPGTKHCIHQQLNWWHPGTSKEKYSGSFTTTDSEDTLVSERQYWWTLRRFYWPGYSAGVERWCQECWLCYKRRTKGPTKRRAKLRWHKERYHRINRRRDSPRGGDPDRVRGPPTPKDEFRATPNIVLDSGKCELHP